jgi:hypothetical protein
VNEVLAEWFDAVGVDYIASVGVNTWRNWADNQILRLDEPPPVWLCDLSLATTLPEVEYALRAGVAAARGQTSVCRETFDRVELYLGVLYLRFLRGELEMTELLAWAGSRVDTRGFRIDCSEFYGLLNEIDGGGPVRSSRRPLIDRVAELFSPFAEYARVQLRGFPMAQCSLLRALQDSPSHRIALDPRWLTSTVLDLARHIDEGFAFERLPILADALMDAGCDDQDIMMHCHLEAPHVRGCWVIDLLLGKQ